MRRACRRAAGLAGALACALAGPAAAQLTLPRPTGYVNDFASVIPAQDEARIDAVIREVRQKSGGEIVVVTLPSLEGRPADEVALQIGREWKVGQQGEVGDPRKATGAVVLVSVQDRKWRIETATGTNTFITAAEAGRIGRDLMLPAFRRNDYGGGILAAVRGLGQEYAEEFGFQLTGGAPAPPPTPQRERPRSRGDGAGFLFMLFILFVLFSAFRGRGGGGRGGGGGWGRRRRRGFGMPVIIPFPMGGGGGWSGGGFGGGGGGGFGGFGGSGDFGGGGAGGDW